MLDIRRNQDFVRVTKQITQEDTCDAMYVSTADSHGMTLQASDGSLHGMSVGPKTMLSLHMARQVTHSKKKAVQQGTTS